MQMLSMLLLQTSCMPQESYPLVPVMLGKIMFSWGLMNTMKWMHLPLKLFESFQTCKVGELKLEIHLMLTDL
jgi:hypothetical protein